jgi:hypothetical protein
VGKRGKGWLEESCWLKKGEDEEGKKKGKGWLREIKKVKVC